MKTPDSGKMEVWLAWFKLVSLGLAGFKKFLGESFSDQQLRVLHGIQRILYCREVPELEGLGNNALLQGEEDCLHFPTQTTCFLKLIQKKDGF